MTKYLICFLSLIGMGMCVVGCNESTLVGSNLLDDESIDLVLVDTISLGVKTLPARPINVNFISQTNILGQLDDPIFGKADADVFFALNHILPLTGADISLDSMVLTIEYDTVGFYGEWADAIFDIEVYEGLEALPSLSDTVLSTADRPIGLVPVAQSSNVSVSINDSFFVYDPSRDTLEKIPTHLRVQFDEVYARQFLSDMQTISNDTELDALYPSMYIKATPDRSASIGLNLGSNARRGGVNGVHVYYTIDTSDIQRVFELQIDRGIPRVLLDYSGSTVESAINDENAGEDFVYVQGMGGVRTAIDLSGLNNLPAGLINKVELEMTVAEGVEFSTIEYPPIDIYAAGTFIDNSFVAVQDFTVANSDPLIFGGILREEEQPDGSVVNKVSMNLTNHVIQYLEDPSIGPEIIVTALSNLRTPRRTIFYGTSHPDHPLKLNVAFTASQ